ncbi:unnamed protein product [Rhodiola kirilowii]
MSDSHIYELEDIAWDAFSVSDNHLVPHPQIEQNEGSHVLVPTESHKKLKHEVGMPSCTGSHGVERVGVANEGNMFSSTNIKSEKVLANGAWSHSHNADAFQTYDDLMTSLSSGDQTMAGGNFISNINFYTSVPSPTNNRTAADNNISYSLSDAHQSESDLSFLYNGHENKEIDDPLFYEWPEIENFDVSQMLRTCDSAFGLGDSAKEDEMCWFSSSTAVNDSDDASKLQARSSYSDINSLKFLSENFESPQPNHKSPAVDAFNKRSAGASNTTSTLASNTIEQSCLSKASSINELPTSSDKMDRDKPLKEVSKHITSMDYQKQTVETNFSPHHFDSSKPTSNTQLSFKETSQRLLSTNDSGPQMQNESLNKNCQLDEISLEETSFRQLQEVMEKLDLKAKLCIRDSLYRLARSAEQRHGVATMIRAGRADKNSNEALTAQTKHAGLLDIETDTNPIDRSIAHLLFHRPSDLSKMPLNNTRPGYNNQNYVEELSSQ